MQHYRLSASPLPPRPRGRSYRGFRGAGAVGVGGLPVGSAVRRDDPRGAVRPDGRGGEQRLQGRVPLRRVPARRAMRVPRARQGPGLPLQVLAERSIRRVGYKMQQKQQQQEIN